MAQEQEEALDTGQYPDEAPIEEVGGSGRHPNSLANLRPPWVPGQSGNPSGLTKDGRPPKSFSYHIEQAIERRGGPKYLAGKLLRLLEKGNAKAIEAILARYDPIEQGGTRTVLEGLRLELHEGGASVTVGRSFADGERRDSDGGTTPLSLSEASPSGSEDSQESQVLPYRELPALHGEEPLEGQESDAAAADGLPGASVGATSNEVVLAETPSLPISPAPQFPNPDDDDDSASDPVS